jgi:uncharacterized protein involved in exopolysaccharide biosynthesis
VAVESGKTRASETTLLRDIVYVVFKRKFPLIALLVIGSLIVAHGATTRESQYEATARVLVKRLRPDYAMPQVTSSVLRRGEVVNSELQIIMSPAVAAEIVDRLEIATGPERGLAIASMERAIRAHALPEADIIDISFRHADPEWAARVVNTALDSYLEIRARVSLNFEAVRYLDEQADRAKAIRDSVAHEIEKLGVEEGDLVQGLRGQMMMGLKDRLHNDQIELASRINSREEELAMVREWLDSDGDMRHVPSGDIYEMGTVRSVYIQVVDQAAELADAAARYAEGHPEVKRVRRELATLEGFLRDEVERALKRQYMRLAEWKAQKRAVDDLLAELDAQDADLAATAVRRRILEADLDARQGIYSVVLDHAELYRITAATDPNLQNVAVVSRAEVPARPTADPVNMRIVVGVFTIIFGVLLIFGIEKADSSLERREDVQRFLGVKVLASIEERKS